MLRSAGHEIGDEAVFHVLVGKRALLAALRVGLRRTYEGHEGSVIQGLRERVVGVEAEILAEVLVGLQRQSVIDGVSARVGIVKDAIRSRRSSWRRRNVGIADSEVVDVFTVDDTDRGS